MRELAVVLVACIVYLPAFSKSSIYSSDVTDSKNKVLFHCGEGSEQGFNGWMVNGLNENSHVYFEQNHLEIFSHEPGSYSVELIKKIDDMVGYNNINVAFDTEEIANCQVNYATAYLSADGKNWTAINKNAKNQMVSAQVEKMNSSFIRLVANITFFSEGRVQFNRAYVTGNYSSLPQTALSDIKTSPSGVQTSEKFFVFQFEDKINIETQTEDTYELVLSNLAGQIIYRERSIGSNRFEANFPKGIYILSIIQNNKLITTKKVAF